jgi:hypothetical protein
LHKRLWGVVLAVAGSAAIAACSEKLDGGAACPSLCPEQSIEVRDTVIDAVTLDSTVAGYPIVGTEQYMMLASRGDTLDVRGVVRFDTLVTRFLAAGVDTAITSMDSVRLNLRISIVGSKVTSPVTIEAYDVDTAAVDTSYNAVLPLYRPDRLLGTLTIPLGLVLPDSVKVPLDTGLVMAKLRDTTTTARRMHIGLRVTAPQSAQLRLLTTESAGAARLSYHPTTADTSVHMLDNSPSSQTPTDLPVIASELTDYTVVAKAPPLVVGGLLAVGGLPAVRTYLRFNVPSRIVDSTTVVRATLLLTQTRSGSVDAKDTLIVYPVVVQAGTGITDVQKSAGIVGLAAVEMDSLIVVPSDSGTKTIDMVTVVRQWRTFAAEPSQRAIVLRAAAEGAVGGAALFFSAEAAPALRPRLRLSYVNRVDFGRP